MAKKADQKADQILRQQGYRYNFERMAYYSREARKAFSLEWVEDHTEEELLQALSERNAGDEWQIYTDVQPSRAVREAFLAEVNG